MLILDLTEPYKHATADFKQHNLTGIQISGAKGDRLQNLDFIFSWIDGNLGKMVVTNNDGKILKVGYMEVSETKKKSAFGVKRWKNVTQWKGDKPGSYFISNFRGSLQGILFLILFSFKLKTHICIKGRY